MDGHSMCRVRIFKKAQKRILICIFQDIITHFNIFVNTTATCHIPPTPPHSASANKKLRPKHQPEFSYCYFIFSRAQRAASCSARFLLLPEPTPIVAPFSLTSTSNRLS